MDVHAAEVAQAKMQAEAAVRRHEDAQHRADIAAAEFGHVAKRGREFVNRDPANRVSEAHKSLLEKVLDIPGTVQQYCKPAVARPVVHPPLKWKITDATARCPLDFLREVYTFALKTGQDAMQALLDSTQDAALEQACRDLMTKVKDADPEAVKCFKCGNLGHISKSCTLSGERLGDVRETNGLPRVAPSRPNGSRGRSQQARGRG